MKTKYTVWLPLDEAKDKMNDLDNYHFEYIQDGEVQDAGYMNRAALLKAPQDDIDVWVLMPLRWISVNDRLPKQGHLVLGDGVDLSGFEGIALVVYDHGDWEGELGYLDVKRWLPIPETE